MVFRSIYNKMIYWSNHRHAPYYLAGVSFVESSFFPIPPDVMLIPMVLTRPFKAWEYAAITTLASILGGLFGYAIGYFAYEWLAAPFIYKMGYEAQYQEVLEWFKHYGVLAVVLAGFTPIPYKVFTIAAGVAQMALAPFILASIVGRGLRFFLVAGLVYKFGKKVEPMLLKYVEWIGWSMVLAVILLTLWLSGCSTFSQQQGAPVIDIHHFESIPRNGVHVVSRGESLYEIAWRYGMDYRELAKINQISVPYTIYPNQKIYLKASKYSPPKKSKVVPAPKPAVPQKPIKTSVQQGWDWPVDGKIVRGFSLKGKELNKGIDIAAPMGTPVKAASGGTVVYSGSALRGYGQLVIVKHNEEYLSAYAHNRRLLVKEGQTIRKGQVIAEMGQSESKEVKLHFEVRKNGKPIDPKTVLSAKI